MTLQLLVVGVVVLVAILAGLAWASVSDRFAKLEKEMEELRTELLFLRGELDLQRQNDHGRRTS